MQRKIFRVEQMFADRRVAPMLEDAGAPHQAHEYKALRALAARREETVGATVQGLERELGQVRDTITRNKQELSALLGERNDRRMARAAGELGAAINAMEKATQKILRATETIDDRAKTLAAAIKNDYEQGLAQDIQEHVVEVYEACNFQDLAGQRIGKVIEMLSVLEEQIAGMIERCGGGGQANGATAPGPAGKGLLNGPKLDGESGHANQSDIDALFS